MKIALGVAFVGAVGWAAFSLVQNKPPAPPQAPPASQPAHPLRPVSKKLFSGEYVVKAGERREVRFTVDPANMENVRVVGRFHASGGANDIQAVLAEEGEFENWVNGHEAQVLYGTGQVTNGRIDVAISRPGTYHLAFSNTFSVLTDKEVSADIELRYLARE